MDEVAKVIARNAITERLAGYCRGIDRCDPVLIRATYHDDCYEDHGDKFQGGPDDFVAWVLPHLADMRRTLHTLHQVNIDFDEQHDDVAWVETYCVALHILGDDSGTETLETLAVRYIDRFENRPSAGWRVRLRQVALEAHAHQPLLPAAERRTGFAPSRRDHDDPSYSRPAAV